MRLLPLAQTSGKASVPGANAVADASTDFRVGATFNPLAGTKVVEAASSADFWVGPTAAAAAAANPVAGADVMAMDVASANFWVGATAAAGAAAAAKPVVAGTDVMAAGASKPVVAGTDVAAAGASADFWEASAASSVAAAAASIDAIPAAAATLSEVDVSFETLSGSDAPPLFSSMLSGGIDSYDDAPYLCVLNIGCPDVRFLMDPNVAGLGMMEIWDVWMSIIRRMDV
eukprot:scaffold81748_cov63-Cyclotella_meneghiniana.AAC.1